MNARQAKREACWRAATVLRTAMESGWPTWDPGSGTDEPNFTGADAERVSEAISELIDELERRGAA